MEEVILDAIIEALRTVTATRFFRSERGYQGRFYCALQKALDKRGVLRDGVILEMEYQKKGGHHGMTQRPDIILHIPVEESGEVVYENNFAVLALKRRASSNKAQDDFRKLDEMCKVLHYPLAVFINIDSGEHHMRCYTGLFLNRVHAFAIRSEEGTLRIIHAWHEKGSLRECEE
jgi:hypothetical protein